MNESEQIATAASSFTIASDPSIGAPADAPPIRFTQVLPHFEDPPRLEVLSNWDAFGGIVLAVLSSDEERDAIYGTATMIGPGIALSATHTFEDLYSDFRTGAQRLMCFGIGPAGAQAWRIKLITPVERTDTCILGLEYASALPPERILYQTALTTRLPEIGEKLVMAGFRAAAESFSRLETDSAELVANLYIASGVVTNQYLEYRDRVKIKWPTLEVDCPTIGGMSGGPVFDSRGYLVGIITSSIEGGPGEEPCPTYTALHWPIFGKEFAGGWPANNLGSNQRTLLDLNGRFLWIERPSAITMTVNGAGIPTASYRPWSRQGE